MQTIDEYIECGIEIRKLQKADKPIPREYQEIIELFIPTENQFPNRKVIPCFEYPDSNPKLFLENKRGFRILFVAIFLSNKMAADFFDELSKNGPLKWQVARYIIEVCDNIIFLKTRGQRLANMLSKLERGIKTQPICMFHYDLKERELMRYLEEGNWALRVVWGPPINVPLYGGIEPEEQKMKVEGKTEMKFELKWETSNLNSSLQQEPIVQIQDFKLDASIDPKLVVKPLEIESIRVIKLIMNHKIQNILLNILNPQPLNVDFLNEDEFYDWLQQQLLLFIQIKDVNQCIAALLTWTKSNYQSSMGIVNQLLILLAATLMKSQPQYVEDLLALVRETVTDKEITTIMAMIQQDNSQSQISVQVQEPSKILKVTGEEDQNSGFLKTLMDLLRCKDKKQK